MDQERRALRLTVRELTWHREPDASGIHANAVVLCFRLTRGSFATTVLRELIDSDPLGDEDQDGS
jgi:tRNA(Glu) U13 pseudouridine synthase TruD